MTSQKSPKSLKSFGTVGPVLQLHGSSMYNALLTKCEVKMARYNYWQVLLCIFMERDEGNNSNNK